MEQVTNKVGIDLELRPELKRAESELNTFITGIVNRIQTLDANLRKLGESGRLTTGVRRRAEEALYQTTEAAYGFGRTLDPATIAGLGGERAITTAVGANISRPLREAQSTLRRYQNDMDSAIAETDKAMQKHSRMIPSYLGTVINTVGQAVQMYANLYRAEKLAFDFSNPNAMASAMMQFEISRTQLLWGGGGRVAGSVLGGGLGLLVTGGNPAGMLAGSYLGSQILGEAGSAIGIFATATPEQQLKMYQQMYGRSMGAVQGVTPVEALIYSILGRSRRFSYAGIAGMIRGVTDLGFTPNQAAQMMNTYGGRPEDFAGYLYFTRATRGMTEGFQAIMNPRTQAEQAFMFGALRRANQGASLMDIQLMMRGGMADPRVRRAMLEQIEGIPRGMRDYFILAMTEGKGVSAETTRALMRAFETGGGGISLADKLLAGTAPALVAPGERAEARISKAQYDLGEAIKKTFREWNVMWEEQLNAFTATTESQKLLKKITDQGIEEFKRRFVEPTEDITERQYPIGSLQWEEQQEVRQRRKQYQWDVAMFTGADSVSTMEKKIKGGTIKAQTIITFQPDAINRLSASNRRPIKVLAPGQRGVR
jgi:hypothetical protein